MGTDELQLCMLLVALAQLVIAVETLHDQRR